MKQDNMLISTGIVSIILAVTMAFSDNLMELAPVFLLTSLCSFGWVIVRKTWPPATHTATHFKQPKWYSISSVFGIAGLLCLGLSGLSLIEPALSEVAVAGVLGAFLLIIAVLLRIINGIRTKKVDATTGVLSISTIAVLLIIIAAVILLGIIAFSILNGLALL